MLTIAGGVIIGILGLWVIIAIIGAIFENIEEIALGCAVLFGVIALIGVWAFLDGMWPEIDWIKTAFATAGGLFAALVAILLIRESRLVRKIRLKEESSPPRQEEASLPNEVEAVTCSVSPASAEKLDEAMPQVAAAPIVQETEDEWRARIARELRLSREPKWPPIAANSYLGKDTEELFSEYVKWKGKREQGEDTS
jgi:membrane-bound ClpP family serine protease